ncbi:MAG: organomercurial lyase [Myxococcota bacterium]
MTRTPLVTVPAEGNRTLLHFWQRMAGELGEAPRHLLNVMARALAERGWIPALPSLISQLVDGGEDRQELVSALADLVRRRLVVLDASHKRVLSLLGTLSVQRTSHRGHLENGVDLFTFGGMELLTLSAMFARPVDAFTRCGHCATEVTFRMEDEAVARVEPSGAAGFQADWDGREPIREMAQRSPVFCSDACLNTWLEHQGEPAGMPLSGILFLNVGVQVANECGQARFEMIKG